MFSGGIFDWNVVLEGVAGIPVFGRCLRMFLQEFLPLFPPKAVWPRPATKEGSLLSKIWTKINLFILSTERDLTMASAAPVLCWGLPA